MYDLILQKLQYLTNIKKQARIHFHFQIIKLLFKLWVMDSCCICFKHIQGKA